MVCIPRPCRCWAISGVICAKGDAWRDKPPPLLTFRKEYAQIAYYDKAIFVFLCMEEVKSPLDLGHDDCAGQECKDGRSRTWMLLLYEDDPSHKLVLDGKLADLDWNFAGRIHDKDDGIKSHHHVVILFKDGRKNADIAQDLGIEKRWLRAWDRQKKALRYLCHRDNPEKYQYSTDGIYGTIAEKAVGACSKGSELSEVQSVKEITQMLREIDGFVSYDYFFNLVCDRGCYSVFRRMGVMGVELIRQHNLKYERRLEQEMRVKRQGRDGFDSFLQAGSDIVPFAKRVEVMDKVGGSVPNDL